MYNNSLEAFVEPFVKERLDKAVTNLAKYFIEQSHNQISMEEAKKQAESILLKDSEKK